MMRPARIAIGILILLILAVVFVRTRYGWLGLSGDEQPWLALERPPIDDQLPVLPVARVLGSENTFGWLFKTKVFSEDIILAIDRQPLVGEEMLLAINRETGEIEHRAAPRGEGPGEIHDSGSIDLLPGNPGQFSLYDNIANRMTIFESSPWTGRPSSYRVHDDHTNAFQAEWLSDTEVVMSGRFDGHLLRFYEADEDERSLTLTSRRGAMLYPSAPASRRLMLNTGHLAVSPDHQKIAFAFALVDLLYFFDATGEFMHMVRGPMDRGATYTSDEPFDSNEVPITYQDMAVSNDHVFALYSGRSGDEQGDGGDSIHVFSWDGEFVAAYALERTIVFLSVDPEGEQIYGVAHEPYPQIVEYMIPREP